jgi:hypothetical protein
MAGLSIAFVAAAAFGIYQLIGRSGGSAGSIVDTSNYQAVFLTNDQVYFGKLENLDGQYPVLEDVYYLVMGTPIQGNEVPSLDDIEQAEGEEGEVSVAPSQAEAEGPSFTLVKLGREIHDPKDKLILNRDHILFIEDLKDDGKLVRALIEVKQQDTEAG